MTEKNIKEREREKKTGKSDREIERERAGSQATVAVMLSRWCS